VQDRVPDRAPDWRPDRWWPWGYYDLRFGVVDAGGSSSLWKLSCRSAGSPPWQITVRPVRRLRRVTYLGPVHGRWSFLTLTECRAWVARVRREHRAEQMLLFIGPGTFPPLPKEP
jgi:hypothetical protein